MFHVEHSSIYNINMIKGIIFDYNGTLVFDDEYNREAWRITYKEITGKSSEDYFEFTKRSNGNMNYPYLEAIFKENNLPYTKELLLKWSHHKEEIYHRLVKEKNNYKLVNGAEEFLYYIKEKKIPINIATASIKYNVDFYFDELNLYRWFDKKIVGHDDGISNTKEEMYKYAAKNINVKIEDCLIIEDSKIAMHQALDAGCKKIIQMNKNKHHVELKEIIQKVNDYTEIDKTIFE